jgi:hypothetical protein
MLISVFFCCAKAHCIPEIWVAKILRLMTVSENIQWRYSTLYLPEIKERPMKRMILNCWHHCLYSTAYWDAMPRSLVDGYQYFRRKHFHLQGRSTPKREAASSPETTGNDLPDASCHMTQDSNFYGPHHHNLKSHTATHKHLMQTYLQATPSCFWNNTVSSRPGMSFEFNSSLQK